MAVSPASSSVALTLPLTTASSATASTAALATGTSFVPVIVMLTVLVDPSADWTVNESVSTPPWGSALTSGWLLFSV